MTGHAQARSKLRGYAMARIPLVWIVDVPARAVAVLSAPSAGAYADERVLRGGDALDPRVPGIRPFLVDDLFAEALGG